MSLPNLYGITEPGLNNGIGFIYRVEAALRGGLKLLQYRDKNASQSLRYERASLLSLLCNEHGAMLIINDDIGLARRTGAAGVHLGQEDGSIVDARRELGRSAIIGATCHDSLKLAERALAEGADYIAFGSFFPSKTKLNAKPASLATLANAKKCFPNAPLVAIGGITLNNARQVIAAGADCVASARGIFDCKDVGEQVKRFLEATRTL